MFNKLLRELLTILIILTLSILALSSCDFSNPPSSNGGDKPSSGIDNCEHNWEIYSESRYCDSNGSIEYYCTKCNDSKLESVDPIGHSWYTEYVSYGDCQNPAVETKLCRNCQASITVEGDYGDHQWTKVESSYLCGTTGFYERVCGVCNMNDNGLTLGLSHDLVIHEGTAPTCTTSGFATYEECTRCNYNNYESLPATNHSGTSWVTVIAPTETTKGVREFVCDNCDFFERAEMPESIYTDGLIYKLHSNGLYYYVTGIDRSINPTATVISVPKVHNNKPVKGISANAFYADELIVSLDLSNSEITTIEKNAFAGCTALESAKLGAKIQTVLPNAFDGAEKLSAVDFGGVTEIYEYAFRGCGIKSVTLPESLTLLNTHAFSYCKDMTSVSILAKAPKIMPAVFSGCTSLSSLTIPYVGESVNYDTNSVMLAYLFIVSPGNNGNSDFVPSTLKTVHLTCETQIKPNTFTGCASIETIILSDKLELTAKTPRYDLSGCTSLRFNSYGNGLYLGTGNNDYYMITGYSSAEATSIDINPATEIIAPNAFKDHQKLESIRIGGSVKIISDQAFSGCVALKSVIIEGGVLTVGACAFSYCTALTDLTISEGVERIENFAFEHCTALTEVTIPASIKFLGYGTFVNSGLTKAYMIDPIGWYILGQGFITHPNNIASLRDPETLAMRLSRAEDEYWSKD